MNQYIGVDLGGTNMRAGIVDPATGKVSHSKSVPTQAREGYESVLKRMADLILGIIKDGGLKTSDIGGIGIGVPGVADIESGVTHFLPNLSGTWPNVPVAATIKKLTGLPAWLLNDVRSITFGEWKFGAGRGVETMACFAIGTGIGGGEIINNHLHLGIGGTAGELGHLIIDFNGPLCGCGNRGCVEAYASGPAIAAAGMRAVAQGWTTSIAELANFDLNKITPKIICQAANAGDRIAMDIYEKAGEAIGIAVANICVVVSARRIVIGGGVAQAGDLLLNPIRRTILERVKIMPVEQVEVVRATLGDDAGVIGVAMWAENRSQH